MHVDQGLGLCLYANAQRRAPTNMHNNAISVNSMHRIRAAQDIALYHLTLTEEVPGFDGAAHLEAWNSDPTWQGVREAAEQLTGIWDWAEAIFAGNIVFEPLVGELFRSGFLMQVASSNGDFITPSVISAAEADYERNLANTIDLLHLLVTDNQHAAHNKNLFQGWVDKHVALANKAAAGLQPIWSQPHSKPVQYADARAQSVERTKKILGELGLALPKE